MSGNTKASEAGAPTDTMSSGAAGTAAGGSDEGSGNWQRRWQPLLGQWVIVSASSADRPWSGALATGATDEKPAHDPACYLCPRVTRASGTSNPDYTGAFAFDNDFPSLSFDAPLARDEDDPLARTAPAHGRCRVLCWSERHDATIASLGAEALVGVGRLWRDEYRALSADPRIANVLIFENKGTEIGVSNLHPHGQIYATDFVTNTATRMREAQARYARERGGASLLQDMLRGEAVQGARGPDGADPGDAHRNVDAPDAGASGKGETRSGSLVVERGEHFSVIVPWAARFAYETWIVPHRHVASVGEMDESELAELLTLYQRQVRRYDVLFARTAPNVTLLHNAPCDDHADNAHWCFHLAFHPPLREPDKMKFLAGFESGADNIVNPVQPERAAGRLRETDVSAWPPR